MATVHVLGHHHRQARQARRAPGRLPGQFPSVHAEDGCLEYVATVNAENAGATQTRFGAETFVVVERWASLAALEAHAVAPHMAAYAAKTRNLIASRVIHVLSPV